MLQPRTFVTAAFFSLSLCVCNMNADTLPLPGSVIGTVVDGVTGAPIAGCRVLARRTTGTIWEDQAAPAIPTAASRSSSRRASTGSGSPRRSATRPTCSASATATCVASTIPPATPPAGSRFSSPFRAGPGALGRPSRKSVSLGGTIVLPGGNEAPATEGMQVSVYDERNEAIGHPSPSACPSTPSSTIWTSTAWPRAATGWSSKGDPAGKARFTAATPAAAGPATRAAARPSP